MSVQAVGAFNYWKLTHAALSSPLWGHVAVAGCARGPIRWHRDLVGGNRRWWWSCQQGSWHNESTTHKFNQVLVGIRRQKVFISSQNTDTEAHQLTWPWWCLLPFPWPHRCGGEEGWAGRTWLQASRLAGPQSCDGWHAAAQHTVAVCSKCLVVVKVLMPKE